MLGWEEIVQNHIIKHSDQIKKLTRPLRDHFGIGYFTYHRIDLEGKYTVLLDRPDWAEHYVGEKIFLNDPYLRHPSVYQSGMCLIESQGTEEYRQTVMKMGRKVLHMDLGAILIQKSEDHVEFFGFSGGCESCCLTKLYLNDPQLLTSFAIHFKKEVSSILIGLKEESNSLLHLKGEDFLNDQPIYPDISASSRLAYLADLGLKNEIETAAKLSVRERECLKLLIENKSSKETAAILKLSPRTIESYFENIKNKFACWSKQDVLAIAKTLHLLGLL